MNGAPELEFEVLGAAHEPFAAQPTLILQLGVTEATGREILAVTLSAQVMLEPARRRYDDTQRADLLDVFGEPGRWPATTHAFLWAHAGTVLHAFRGATTCTLPLPCSADLEVPATRYIDALGDDGAVPMHLHFSGRVLYAGEVAPMQVAYISWSCSSQYEMPVGVWRAMVAEHHGDTRFVRVHRDTLAALTRHRSAQGLHTYDAAVTELLEGAQAHVGE